MTHRWIWMIHLRLVFQVGSLLQESYFNYFYHLNHPVSSVYSDSLSFHAISGRHQNILIAKLKVQHFI
jgi:hypothetical protein